jgi:hypothetical protein
MLHTAHGEAMTGYHASKDGAFLLKRMAGRPVQLPGHRDFWPDKTHLAWNRINRLEMIKAMDTKEHVSGI